ncbi:uncharacterized protein NEMAJ01_0262 [Nematocida major]|uniref:uncharacterized protein n=1 Tax=Nematocida major TaxID=1912982 RepID=UPI0020081E6C|nr:uncharacterized protein NEMAJ01_0262 [Nematocida major]KAH9385366.1 hypothetical protein NEMAJ01_0262 [Nematocida major]
MEEKKNLAIIDKVLEDTGIVRYNALKNRFRSECNDSPTLLCFYKNTPASSEETSIDLYRANLLKLRRKIEERKVRVLSHAGRETITETLSTTVSEALVSVSPNGTATPLQLESIPSYNLSVDNVGSLNDFKYATVLGAARVIKKSKQYESELKLEGHTLTTTVIDKKNDMKTIIDVDVTLAKLFLVVKNNDSFFSCMNKPTRYVHLHKEIDVMNITVGKPSQIILKNVTNGTLFKEAVKSYEFAVQDVYGNTVLYKTQSPDEFIRWLLLIRSRMYTVDRWSKDELLNSIRR